jgi:hypothetical protein
VAPPSQMELNQTHLIAPCIVFALFRFHAPGDARGFDFPRIGTFPVRLTGAFPGTFRWMMRSASG